MVVNRSAGQIRVAEEHMGVESVLEYVLKDLKSTSPIFSIFSF
jgi:hypothetical protein